MRKIEYRKLWKKINNPELNWALAVNKVFLYNEKFNKYLNRKNYIIGAILFLLLLFNSHNFKTTKDADLSIQVDVATARKSDIPVLLSAIGNVTPDYNITVYPQINGNLKDVLFAEGQKVKKGDLLAQIDDAIYAASVLQYEGQLSRDKALLENARLDLKRYEELWKENSVSKQIFDTQLALVKQYEGIVKLDEGQLASSKANLEYCKIKSPIDGQVGLRLVDPGNNITTATQIAVVNTVESLAVIFAIPESDIHEVVKAYQNDKKIKTSIYDSQQGEVLAVGYVRAIDNQIDASTGSLKIKAIFDNSKNNLFPNQFVNVKMQISNIKDAIIIPIKSVQHGKNGDYVFKVAKEMKVAIQSVKLGSSIHDEVAVISGIDEGDLVVTEGSDKVISGSSVKFSK